MTAEAELAWNLPCEAAHAAPYIALKRIIKKFITKK
jgi:hypothetical protein